MDHKVGQIPEAGFAKHSTANLGFLSKSAVCSWTRLMSLPITGALPNARWTSHLAPLSPGRAACSGRLGDTLGVCGQAATRGSSAIVVITILMKLDAWNGETSVRWRLNFEYGDRGSGQWFWVCLLAYEPILGSPSPSEANKSAIGPCLFVFVYLDIFES
jgi:hypothetical protein